MARPKLEAKVRNIFGRKVKALRKQGMIPANVFGPNTKSQAITLDSTSFTKLFQDAGETTLIDLKIDSEKTVRPILISNIHQDPVTGDILHADLHQVDLKSKTTAEVPVVTTGKSPATEKGGILVMLRNSIEVEALPADLPENIEVDISSLLEIGDSILAKDLNVNRTKLTLEIDEEEPIVTVQEPEEEPEEPEETEEAEASEETEKEQPEEEGAKEESKEESPKEE